MKESSPRRSSLASINYPSRSFSKLQPVTRLNLLYRAWNEDIEQLHQLASRNIMKRLIHHGDDAKAISDHIQAITWSIQNLTVPFTCLAVLSPFDRVLHWCKQVESVLAVEFTLDVSELYAA